MTRQWPESTKHKRLVIVESPAKAKTIAGYLGDGYIVEASVGHIRDLPRRRRGAREVQEGERGPPRRRRRPRLRAALRRQPDKKKQVAELKQLLEGRRRAPLATDEDREGEAIAWHLLEVLKPKVPVNRMVFHEITRDAIHRALGKRASSTSGSSTRRRPGASSTGSTATRSRRSCGRRSCRGLSAGRVQSVATRLVVERERERMAFSPPQYWDLEATFDPERSRRGSSRVDGKRVAHGRDFGPDGKLRSRRRRAARRGRRARPRRPARESPTSRVASRRGEAVPRRPRRRS